MMIIDNIYSLYGLLISNSLLLAAATIAVLRLQRMLDCSDAFWDSLTGAHLKEQSDAASISQLVDKRFSSLQETVDDVIRKGSPLQGQITEKLPFENAVRMARHGASADDITRNCGLSKSEARLLMRVHCGTDANQPLK